MDRKEKIIKTIKKSDKPISASKLAAQFGVSRQTVSYTHLFNIFLSLYAIIQSF